jgi:DNA-binding response OmpR family regulator
MATQNDKPSESPSHDVRQRLLIVEDERKVANALREGLEGENYRVTVEENGEAAFFRLNTEQFDLVLLDLGLPARDGLDILKALRDDNNEIPVLILTARDTTADRVNGLRTGADDYLVKPFAFAELLARIEVLLRRGKVTSTQRLIAGDIEIDLQTRHVTRNRQLIELTAKEYEFLVYLMQHDQQVVSRETIARELWPETVRSTTLNNIIDVHISKLRRKIECGNLTKVIHTVRGVGFMLREEKP